MKSIILILAAFCFITAPAAFSESTFTCNTDTVSASYVIDMAERLQHSKHDDTRDFVKPFTESFETVAWWDRTASNPLTSREKMKLGVAINFVLEVIKIGNLTASQTAFFSPYKPEDQVAGLQFLKKKLAAVKTN